MNNNKLLNIINYNEYTSNIKHWNPFEEFININDFNNKKQQLYILGPSNIDNLRYLWLFNIKKNNNELIISSIKNSKNYDPCINIFIKNNIGKINYMNKCGDYKGKDLIKWMLQIMKQFGCEKCILQDVAQKNCNGRNKHNYVLISLIHKLWKGHTYYEDFGFIPYDKNNNSYIQDKLLELNNKIKNLQEIRWDYFDIHDKKWTEFKNKYSYLYPSPFCAFREFTPDKCNIFYDILFFVDDLDLFNDICNIISKSTWMKIM